MSTYATFSSSQPQEATTAFLTLGAGSDGPATSKWLLSEDAVRHLLAAGTKPSGTQSRYRNTALLASAREGHISGIQVLLQQGADIQARDNSGNTALSLAASKGYLEIVDLLLQHGANIQATNNSGTAALSLAAGAGQIEVVQHLLQNGADLQAIDQEGRTALMEAAWEGQTETVALLLQKGADIQTADHKGQTAAMVATWEGHLGVAQLLLEHGAVSPVSEKSSPWKLEAKSSLVETSYIFTQRGGIPQVNTSFSQAAWRLAKRMVGVGR